MMLTCSLKWLGPVNNQLMVQNVSFADLELVPLDLIASQLRRINVDSESAQRDNESGNYYK